MSRPLRRLALGIGTAGILLGSCACAIGPAYVRPEVPASAAFREALPAGWKEAQPTDAMSKGAWWTIYRDSSLDGLEADVSISNQNVLAAEAQYRAAKAAVRVTRAGQFPSVTTVPAATRAGTGGSSGVPTFAIPIEATYTADVWGSIRRSVAANTAVAQASAAQLENARLSYQAEVAADYFQIQGLDAERQLLEATVKSYEEYRQLTQDRFDGGVASMADVAQAETQLESTRAQLVDLGIARAQFEHAVAVLTGRPPSALSMPASGAQAPPPPLLASVPSALLERRPDVAAAERQVAAANAQIGVARAAYFPSVILGASASSQVAAIADLLTVPTRVWSVGVQLAATLFDGGKRRAQVTLSEAGYDATVANYRQTSLTAMQQVEDSLAELRLLGEEAEVTSRAVAAAQQSLDISTIQYRGGLANSLQVIIAQTSLLQNQRAAVGLLTRRMLASVALIQALGGGWDASQLPSPDDVRR